MGGWQERVLKQFSNRISLYVVSDNYDILNHLTVREILEEQQLVVINYDDPVVFRYVYEKKYKDAVKEKTITVIIRTEDGQFNRVPFDILRKAVKLTFTIDIIFPNIHSEVIKKIPKDFYSAIDSVSPHCLFASINETLDYLLLELFSINVHLMQDDKSLVKAAINYFENYQVPLPDIFVQRLCDLADEHASVNTKLIEDIFTSEEKLLGYLNLQWAEVVAIIEELYDKQSVAEKRLPYGNSLFDDYSIQKRLPGLFTSRKMKSIKVKDLKPFEKWMIPGLVEDSQLQLTNNKNQILKLERNFSSFQLKDWLSFSIELAAVQNEIQQISLFKKEWEDLLNTINKHFEKWMLEKYHHLHSLPPVPTPKMVHQIPHYLSRFSDKKIALLVLDGMNMAQWMVIKESLFEQELKVDEKSTFAWVPSSTTISRQSIFSGFKPYEFSDSILTTNKEKKQWMAFWRSKGIPEKYVAYEKSLGLKQYSKMDLACFATPTIKVYGAVIDVIDQFMHGATQGNQTVHSEIKTWLQTKYLYDLISDLLDAEFEVFITSDHGNKECKGIGRINEGVTVEIKGERMRTYSSSSLRNNAVQKYPDTLAWTDVGLPNNFHVLLAKNDSAFVPISNRIVTHGGISMEEVIVPFVKVSK